ncbi:hypothetical protein KKE48_00670, partial [Patescibacteria group bacterium]|nr:hypothetical protein [Patescibacteria group bacterium]
TDFIKKQGAAAGNLDKPFAKNGPVIGNLSKNPAPALCYPANGPSPPRQDNFMTQKALITLILINLFKEGGLL